MEKTILLKVIQDDGYVVTAIRPVLGAKLQLGQHLEFDLGKLSSRQEIFSEKAPRPETGKGNVEGREKQIPRTGN
jgi:hypothetical protein